MLNNMSYWIVQYLLPIHLAHLGSIHDHAPDDYISSLNHYTALDHFFAIYHLVTSR
jgi:hypothetical protein